jgi:hypothetical protein
VIVYDASGSAEKHEFPLDEGEKKLSGLSSSAVKPLKGAELRANRKLVDPRKVKEFARGTDTPFPSDMSDPAKEKPEGERRVAEKASATGQEPEEKKEDAEAKKDEE